MSPEKLNDVMAVDERDALQNRPLLIKSAPSWSWCSRGSSSPKPSTFNHRWLRYWVPASSSSSPKLEQSDYLANVEWDTLLFMVGLFIMVGALFKTGVIKTLGQMAADATGGNVLLTTMLILGVSMLLSGIIDNVPYVATMTPIVSHLASVIPGQAHHDVMWWSLALGGDLGGNLTAVGSSANIVMVGIALKSGNPISFWQFTRKGVLVTAMSTILCALYLWLRYFVLS